MLSRGPSASSSIGASLTLPPYRAADSGVAIGAVDTRLDESRQHEPDRGRRADRHRRALAREITEILEQRVDVLGLELIRKPPERVSRRARIVAILRAETVVDRTRGIAHQPREFVERTARFLLAIDDIGARLAGRLLLQLGRTVLERRRGGGFGLGG